MGWNCVWGSSRIGTGSFAFLIYINNLEEGIKYKVIHYADGTSLFSIVIDPVLSAAELNHDLETIELWAYE